ncbi:MAG: right-handed parallel beta-helix repeat-containing protein [Proteobacteria bacterium]|nr:right-handed parallel beta-helix repeat-containing protein [Pseudomonadota bacterium]
MRTLLIACLLLLSSRAAHGQALGAPPPASLGARDVYDSFRLPPLKDSPATSAGKEAQALQVWTRARRLGVDNARSASQAWSTGEDLLRLARARAEGPAPASAHTYTGGTASGLNALLREGAITAVRVAGPVLTVDEPLSIRRSGVWLDLGEAELRPAGPHPFLLRVDKARDVTVRGGRFTAGAWGALINGGENVALLNGLYEGLTGGGMVLTGTRGAVVYGNRLTRIGGAPILVHGETTRSVVAENAILGNTGSSNWHAGVVITDRNADVASDPRSIFEPDGYWVLQQPIPMRLKPPRFNVVGFNRIATNASSGIYSDGGVQNVIVSNLIEGNSKEGLCLDNGTTASVVAMNLVQGNGKRWGKSDEDLKLDFVAGFGRLPDGTSPAKVPGISIDNAVYNLVYSNEVNRNFGGGVKMVRTAFFNVVGLNTLTDNNEGASERFHFFGVEMGSAKADAPAIELDFTASRGNIVFSNVIRGNHYAGVFFGPGSDANDVFDNAIFGAKSWAMESVSRQSNSTVNNLTNMPSRNIDAGLDPALITLSRGRFD